MGFMTYTFKLNPMTTDNLTAVRSSRRILS